MSSNVVGLRLGKDEVVGKYTDDGIELGAGVGLVDGYGVGAAERSIVGELDGTGVSP